MRRLLTLLAVILGCSAAHAACTAPAPGSNEAATVSAIAACSSSGGGSLNYSAGTYGPFTSNFTLPCGVSLSGPVVPYSQTHNQTAIFTSSSSFIGQPLQTTAGCSATQAIQYIEWNGEQPTTTGGGGGFVFVTPGTTNLNITHMWIHGMTAPNSDTYGDQNTQANGIYFCCSVTDPVSKTINITFNEFGSESYSDCSQAMLAVQTENGGGFCNGVGIHANTQNVNVNNNIFHYLEQGMKYYESSAGGGYCQNDVFNKNDFQFIQRIPYETQCNLGANPATPTLMYIQYNSFGQRYNGLGGQANYDLSSANGCTNGSSSTCEIHNDYNVDIAPVAFEASPVNHRGEGFEIWGAQNTTVNYNFFEGFMQNSITNSLNGAFTENNNFMNNPSGAGVSQNCLVPEGIYWNLEQATAFNPSCSGNTFSSVGTGTLTSAAPTISPSSGSFSGSQTVTLTNTGTNRDTNTTLWYTTDGSTPVPGSGTAVAYTAPFSVTATTTVKVVGMWGAINQPYSYPSGYGYVPSAVQSATYTTSSGLYMSPTGSDSNSGTMASPWLSPNHAMTGGQTITALAGTYSTANLTSGKWGTVTPSGSNLIAWVTCATFDACKVNSTGGDAIWVDKDYWGVSGFEATTNSSSNQEAACFRATPSTGGNYILHHVVFANDIANGCKGGGFVSYNTSTTASSDYLALVGDIAYNAAQGNGECYSGLSIYEPINFDTTSGTHLYASGNFSYANLDPNPCAGSTPTDGEGIIFDTFDGRNSSTPVYTGQAVMQNNIAFFNGGRSFEVVNNSQGTTHANVYVKSNTSFGNSTDNNQTGGCFARGELYGQNIKNVTWQFDLAQTRTGTSCSGEPLYGFTVLTGDSTSNIGNSWWSGTGGNNTDPSTPAAVLGTGNTVGTNPAFTNPVNPGAPSCGSFASTVACMATVITNYTPTVSGSTTNGYQTPSNTSISDALFPTWLCNGSALIAGFPSGLVTPGCGGASPIPSGGFLGNPTSQNTIAIGAGTIPFTAYIFYSNNPATNALPDGYGNVVGAWSIVNGSSACGTVNSSGVFTPAVTGTCNVKATCTCSTGITVNQWTMTVTPMSTPAPPLVQSITISEERQP